MALVNTALQTHTEQLGGRMALVNTALQTHRTVRWKNGTGEHRTTNTPNS